MIYAVEVTNRPKGLDLVDRLPEELQMEVHNIVQEAVTKSISKKKKCKKTKWLSKSKTAVWGGLTNSCEKKRGEKQRRKAKI